MMTSTKKIVLLFLTCGILLIATIYHSNNSEYAENIEKNVELQIIRRRRAIRSGTIHYCKLNQYYDEEEGRCLGVPGGGKVLHIENKRSCGINVLKPHCKSSLYYHICKRDKSILAQCANRQIFDNRLQRCVYYDSSKLTPSIIPPDDYMYYNHVRMPLCMRSGRFPVPDHCSMFYTCDTNGHRLYQNVFKCPQNMGYQVDKGVCNIVANCLNDNSVDTICVPDAPGENIEFPSVDEATKGNVKEISEEILEESKISEDPILEKEENLNSKTYDDIVTTTPANIIGILSENNYNDNNNDTEESNNASSLKAIKEDLISDDIDEKIKHSQAPNQSEIVEKVSDKGQNEGDGSSILSLQITSPSTIELDDIHSITTSMTSIKPENRTNTDVNSETADNIPLSSDYIQYKNTEDSAVTLPNFNTEAIDSHSTINNAQEISPISDVLSKINEKTQDVTTEQYRINKDSTEMPPNFNTDLVEPHLISTVTNVPESFPISDISANINGKMQDAITEQYRNKEDSTVTPSNFNIDLTDLYSTPTINNVQESSPISDVSSNINEKMQDKITERYRNNEDDTVTPSNFNTDSVHPYSAPTISNVPESSPISDISSNIDEKMQDMITEQYRNNEDSTVTPSNFNANSADLYTTPTISNVPESSPISDMSSNIDEKMQDMITEQYRNNDSTVTPSNFNANSADLYTTPTISNIPESSLVSATSPNISEKMQDAIIEQYRNNEDSTVTPSNFNIDSTDLYSVPTISNVPESSPISDMSSNIDEKMQDMITEQYRNNEDSTVTPSNFNTDSVDPYSAPTISNVPESSPISDISSNIDEKMQDMITEQYRNNEDSTVTPSNFNANSADLYSTPTINNVPETSPISDISNIDEKMQDMITEQYRNNEDSTVTPSNFNANSADLYTTPTISNIPESSLVSAISPNISEKMQDVIIEQYRNNEDSTVTPSNFNIDSTDLYSVPTISNVPESSPISDMSSNIDEKMQDMITEQYKNNEGGITTPSNFNTDSADLYSTPTISNVPEFSPIGDMSPNINEKMQDAITEQYKNNGDSDTSNFNTDAIDPTRSSIEPGVVPEETFPINNTSSKLDEEIQNVTEMYKKQAVTLPNSSTEVVDPDVISALNDTTLAITDSTRSDNSDVISSPSTLAILPTQAAVDHFTKGLSEAIPSIESKFADINLSTPDGVESVSAQYLPENIDDLYLTSTSGSLIPKETFASMDITTTIPFMQDPSISNTDLITQNGKDSTEAFPVSFIE